MLNKKLVLFPMNRDLCAVARYSHLLNGYTLLATLIPSSLKLNRTDICKIDGGPATGIFLSDCNESKINDCDVIFLDYNENLPSLSLYQEAIACANNLGKEIVLTRQLAAKLKIQVKNEPLSDIYVPNILYECAVPVISILTQGIHTNQFAVELALRNYFMAKGYNVSQIGSHEAGQFFGFHSQPSFLHENRNADEKILLYNQHIKGIEAAESSDLFILGVPGAIMKYNNHITQGLGVIPYIITNAVRSDASIYCMHYAVNLKNYLLEIAQHCNYRLDCSPKVFNIANVAASPSDNSNSLQLNYMTLQSSYVLQSLTNEIEINGFNVFNALESDSIVGACEEVESILTDNVKYLL